MEDSLRVELDHTIQANHKENDTQCSENYGEETDHQKMFLLLSLGMVSCALNL